MISFVFFRRLIRLMKVTRAFSPSACPILLFFFNFLLIIRCCYAKIGNHEYDFPGQPFAPEWAGFGETDSGGECGVPYSRRFRTPVGEVDGFKGASTLWYSFSHGPVFFVMMSTEHDFTTGSEQWSFLNATLASVDRQKTPWIVFQVSSRQHRTRQGNTRQRLQRHSSPLRDLCVSVCFDKKAAVCHPRLLNNECFELKRCFSSLFPLSSFPSALCAGPPADVYNELCE